MYISKRSSMDHTVLPANTQCLLSFVCVHQMAPPLSEERQRSAQNEPSSPVYTT